MRQTGQAWERLTESIGRSKQRQSQRIFNAGFSADAAQRDASPVR
jgi:hypothetical protein